MGQLVGPRCQRQPDQRPRGSNGRGQFLGGENHRSRWRGCSILAAGVRAGVAAESTMLQGTGGAATTTMAKPRPPIRAAGRTVWGKVSSFIYLPALLVPAFALLLLGASWATGWGGVDFAGSLTSLRAETIGPIAAALIVLFLIVERVRPAQRRPLVARGHRHDVLFAVINVVVVLPLVTALTLSFSDVVRKVAPWVVLPRFGVVPRWVPIIVILVAMDGCNWFVHMANHRV